jgi:hypothetical protein
MRCDILKLAISFNRNSDLLFKFWFLCWDTLLQSHNCLTLNSHLREKYIFLNTYHSHFACITSRAYIHACMHTPVAHDSPPDLLAVMILLVMSSNYLRKRTWCLDSNTFQQLPRFFRKRNGRWLSFAAVPPSTVARVRFSYSHSFIH